MTLIEVIVAMILMRLVIFVEGAGIHCIHCIQCPFTVNRRGTVAYLKNCRWWFGYLFHALGAFISAVAFGLGDQALLMPLQSISLVFNAIFAYFFLHEKLSKIQILGTVLIVFGCAFAVAYGPKSDDSAYNASELLILFENTDFILFTASITLIVAIDYVVMKCEWMTHPTFLMFSYIAMSSYFGSWNPLFTKCFVEMVLGSSSSWTHWLSYTSIVLVIGTNVALEYWKQEALKRFNANYVGSIYNGTVVIGGTSFGAIFFEEFQALSTVHLALFLLAVAASVLGIMLLASPGVDHGDSDKEQKETMLQDHGENEKEEKGTMNMMQEQIELQSVCSTMSSSSLVEEPMDSNSLQREHEEISADYVASTV